MGDQPAGRILIVDDDRGHREALGRVFTQAGYGVDLASSGEAALASLAASPADLVISDLRMPQMNGHEFLRHVKLCWPTTQVIILTAFGDSISSLEAMEHGAFQFLSKPVKRADILALAYTAVRKARALKSTLAALPGSGRGPEG